MQENLQEVRRQLEIEANRATGMALPNDTFSELFNFLTDFSVNPDICPLQSIISSQIEKIVTTIFMSFIGDDDSVFGNVTSPEDRRVCLMNATRSFTQTDSSILINFLGRLLYDYKEFVKSVYFAERVIHKLRYHIFTPSCATALTRMKYCSYCGGFSIYPPCLNLCMNTFRGCLADVAEVNKEFKVLLKLMREHTIDVLPNLKIEAMRDGFANLVSLVRYLATSERELKAAVSQNLIIIIFTNTIIGVVIKNIACAE